MTKPHDVTAASWSREVGRKALKEELRLALHDLEVDQHELAEAADIDPSIISRHASRKCPDSPRVLDLAGWLRSPATRTLGRRLLEWLAGHGELVVSARTEATGASSWMMAMGKVAARAGMATHEIAHALAGDQLVDHHELAVIEGSLGHLEQAVAELRQLVDLEKAERDLSGGAR